MSNGSVDVALNRTAAVGSIVAAIPVAIGLVAAATSDGPRGAATTTVARTSTEFSGESPLVSAQTARGFMNVYFGNLHAHTSLSDGVDGPEDAFEHARDRAHLDFMALTEHNHAQAGKIATNSALYSGSGADSLISIANRITENGEFVALYGQEFSTIGAGNHVNVIDVPRVIDVENGAFDQLLRTFLPANSDTLGGLPVLLLNHPATSGSSSAKEYGRDDFGSDAEWVRQMGNQAALMAMINGPSHSAGEGLSPSQPAESEFFRYLNLGFHIAPTADQDNHRATWGTITDARTAVVADELTKAALLRAMKARHVYATEDKNLRIDCRVNGQRCGERLNAVPTNGAELDIRILLHDDDEPAASYEIDVFSDQIGGDSARNPIEVVGSNGNMTSALRIQDVRYEGGAQYVFFRIRQLSEDGESDRAWTAPIWIEPTTTLTPSGAQPVVEEARIVASRNSVIFHSDPKCRDAQSIKASNRITGPEAKHNREPHQGCPR